MAFRNISVALTADVAPFRSALAEASATARQFVETLATAGSGAGLDRVTGQATEAGGAVRVLGETTRVAGEQAQGAFGGLDGQLSLLSEQTAKAAGEQQQFATAAEKAGSQAQSAYGAAGRAAADSAALARTGFEEAAGGISTLVGAAGEAKGAIVGIGTASRESAGLTISAWERTGVVMGGVATTSTEAATAQRRLAEASTVSGDTTLSAMMQVERTLGLVGTALERLTALEARYGEAAVLAGNSAAAAHERAAVTGGGPGGGGGGGGGFSSTAIGASQVAATTEGGFFGGFVKSTVPALALFTVGMKAGEELIKVSKEAFHGAQMVSVGLNQADIIFGKFSEHVVTNTEHLGRQFGFSNGAMLQAADNIGKVGTSMGLTQEDASKLATSFEPVIGAVARFKGTDIETVGAAFQKGLLGQSKGLKLYGVQLDETHLHQAALELGIRGTTKEWSNVELVQVRARSIMDQLSSVTSNLAKSQDTLAGRIATARGHLENWLEAAGHAATPALLGFFDGLGEAVHRLNPFFSSLGDTAGHVGIILRDLAQEFGPLLAGFAGLVGTGVIETLNGISAALDAVSGFFAHNKTLVEALAIAYAVSLVPAVAEAVTSFATLAAVRGIEMWESVTAGVTRLAAAFITLAPAEAAAAAAAQTSAGAQVAAQGEVLAAVSATDAALAAQVGIEEAVGAAAVVSATEQTVTAGGLLATLGRVQIGWAGIGLAVAGGVIAIQRGWSGNTANANNWVEQQFGSKPAQTVDAMVAHLNKLTHEYNTMYDSVQKGTAGGIVSGAAHLVGKEVYLTPGDRQTGDRMAAIKKEHDAELRDYQALAGGIQMASKQTGMSISATQAIAEGANLDLSKGAKGVAAEIKKVSEESRALVTTEGLSAEGANRIALAADRAGLKTADLGKLLGEAASKTGLTTNALLDMAERGDGGMGRLDDRIKNVADSIAAAGDAAGKAFAGSFDIIGKLGSAFATKDIFGIDALAHPETPGEPASTGDKGASAHLAATRAADSHTAAIERLTAAQKHLAELQAKPGTSQSALISAQNAVAQAQRRVETSATAMGIAQHKAATVGSTAATKTKGDAQLTAGVVEQVYGRAVQVGGHLIDTLQTAIQRGLNPHAVQQLMSMPVEQAQPVLDALIGDASGGVIKTLNTDSELLSKWSTQAVRMARITQVAINATSETITNDLDLAMKVDQAEWASGGTATAQALATSLGVKIEDVRRVVQEYGLVVKGGVEGISIAVGTLIQHSEIRGGTSIVGGGKKLAVASGGVLAGGVLDTQWGRLPVESIGGGFADNRPHAIVSEGSSYREYVVPTDPKHMTRAKHLTAALMQDLGMLPAPERPTPRQMAAGGTLNDPRLPKPPELGGSGALPDSARLVTNTMYLVAMAGVEAAKRAATAAGGGAGGSVTPPPGTVPGNVASWLQMAIALTHVPNSWLGPLEVIAMHESGGNPHSINKWDSNAQRGDPSRGLMQTIGATFMAHALPGHTDIWNPVDNAAAAIRYIQGRYGDVFHTPGIASMAHGGGYKPYAAGGILGGPVVMLASGGLMESRTHSMVGAGQVGHIGIEVAASHPRGSVANSDRGQMSIGYEAAHRALGYLERGGHVAIGQQQRGRSERDAAGNVAGVVVHQAGDQRVPTLGQRDVVLPHGSPVMFQGHSQMPLDLSVQSQRDHAPTVRHLLEGGVLRGVVGGSIGAVPPRVGISRVADHPEVSSTTARATFQQSSTDKRMEFRQHDLLGIRGPERRADGPAARSDALGDVLHRSEYGHVVNVGRLHQFASGGLVARGFSPERDAHPPVAGGLRRRDESRVGVEALLVGDKRVPLQHGDVHQASGLDVGHGATVALHLAAGGVVAHLDRDTVRLADGTVVSRHEWAGGLGRGGQTPASRSATLRSTLDRTSEHADHFTAGGIRDTRAELRTSGRVERYAAGGLIDRLRDRVVQHFAEGGLVQRVLRSDSQRLERAGSSSMPFAVHERTRDSRASDVTPERATERDTLRHFATGGLLRGGEVGVARGAQPDSRLTFGGIAAPAPLGRDRDAEHLSSVGFVQPTGTLGAGRERHDPGKQRVVGLHDGHVVAGQVPTGVVERGDTRPHPFVETRDGRVTVDGHGPVDVQRRDAPLVHGASVSHFATGGLLPLPGRAYLVDGLHQGPRTAGTGDRGGATTRPGAAMAQQRQLFDALGIQVGAARGADARLEHDERRGPGPSLHLLNFEKSNVAAPGHLASITAGVAGRVDHFAEGGAVHRRSELQRTDRNAWSSDRSNKDRWSSDRSVSERIERLAAGGVVDIRRDTLRDRTSSATAAAHLSSTDRRDARSDTSRMVHGLPSLALHGAPVDSSPAFRSRPGGQPGTLVGGEKAGSFAASLPSASRNGLGSQHPGSAGGREAGDVHHWMTDQAIARLPHFALGGLVPGPLGSEQVVVAHGGERVLPAQPVRVSGGTGGGAGSIIHVGDINVPLHLDGARFGPDLSARDVERIVEKGTDAAVDKLTTILEGVG